MSCKRKIDTSYSYPVVSFNLHSKRALLAVATEIQSIPPTKNSTKAMVKVVQKLDSLTPTFLSRFPAIIEPNKMQTAPMAQNKTNFQFLFVI